MIEFVVGFAFDEQHRKVLLLRKNRPEFQKGKLNGVGGKIDPKETPHQAMVREFQEEVGLSTSETDWRMYCTLTHSAEQSHYHEDVRIYFFGMISDEIWHAVNKTDEGVELIHVPDIMLVQTQLLSNLPWLINMFLYDDTEYMVQEKIESE